MFFIKKKIDKLPKHVAFICDGNRRWAKLRGRATTYGYMRAIDIVENAANYLFENGVQIATFFCFSTENWSRPKHEVDYLMNLLATKFGEFAERAHKKDIRVRVIGRRDKFKKSVVKMFEKFEEKTSENTAGTVVLALDYGGRDEILRATNAAIADGVAVDSNTFETYMDTGDLLDVDLVVRTSREMRMSNFILWRAAYAELLFYPKFWPSLRRRDFKKMLQEFAQRNRRYGK